VKRDERERERGRRKDLGEKKERWWKWGEEEEYIFLERER
jgi:hypothetical protein